MNVPKLGGLKHHPFKGLSMMLGNQPLLGDFCFSRQLATLELVIRGFQVYNGERFAAGALVH